MTAVAEALAHAPRLFAWILAQRAVRNREREVFLRVLQQGMTVLDIGANVGDYSRLFSVLVGPRGIVHAFEPIPQTHKTLASNVANRPNVRVHQLALGEYATTHVMTVPAGDFGQASLAAHSHGAWSGTTARETVPVAVAPLDELFQRGTITAPDMIKIDVEGAERLVLAGAKTLISIYHPVLYFEVFAEWTRAFGYAPLDVLRDVEALGYTELLLLDEELRPLPPVAALSTWPASGSTNVLALPPTALGDATRRRLLPLLAEASGRRR